MKYKVGDKVRIKKDLAVDDYYDEWVFTSPMKEDVESNDYILTISRAYIAYDGKTPVYRYEENTRSSMWELTEGMIEGLADPTDREKFKKWARELSSLDGSSIEWCAFNNLTLLEPDDDEYESNLDVIADHLFGVERKKMTKAEIEKALGYKIEIVEE